MGEQVDARIIWGCSSVGRAPALQAGGQEFESLHLHLMQFSASVMYLENRILKYLIQIFRSRERKTNIKTSEVLHESVTNKPRTSNCL